jgi:hypothetical protein
LRLLSKHEKNGALKGPRPQKKFEHTLTALFRVPKSVVAEKIKGKKKKGKD